MEATGEGCTLDALQPCWCLSCPGEDFAFPATEGKRPEKTWLERLKDGHLGELVRLQASDEDTFRAVTPVRSPSPPVTIQGLCAVAHASAKRHFFFRLVCSCGCVSECHDGVLHAVRRWH